MKTRRLRLMYHAVTQTIRLEKSIRTIDVHHGLGGHSILAVISAPTRDTTLRSRSRGNINHSKCSLFIIFSRVSREFRAECNLFRKKTKSHRRVERPGIIRHSEMAAAARQRVGKRILREVRMGLTGGLPVCVTRSGWNAACAERNWWFIHWVQNSGKTIRPKSSIIIQTCYIPVGLNNIYWVIGTCLGERELPLRKTVLSSKNGEFPWSIDKRLSVVNEYYKSCERWYWQKKKKSKKEKNTCKTSNPKRIIIYVLRVARTLFV